MVALSRLRAVVVIGGVVVVDVVGEAVTHGLLIEILRAGVCLALVQLAVGISEVAAAIRAVPVGGAAVLRAGGGVACRALGIGVVASRNDGIGDGLSSCCVSEQLVAVAALPVLQAARLGAGGGGSVVMGQAMMVGIRGAIGSAADAAGGPLGAGGGAVMAAQRVLQLAAGNGAGPPVLGVIVLPIAPLVVAGVGDGKGPAGIGQLTDGVDVLVAGNGDVDLIGTHIRGSGHDLAVLLIDDGKGVVGPITHAHGPVASGAPANGGLLGGAVILQTFRSGEGEVTRCGSALHDLPLELLFAGGAVAPLEARCGADGNGIGAHAAGSIAAAHKLVAVDFAGQQTVLPVAVIGEGAVDRGNRDGLQILVQGDSSGRRGLPGLGSRIADLVGAGQSGGEGAAALAPAGAAHGAILHAAVGAVDAAVARPTLGMGHGETRGGLGLGRFLRGGGECHGGIRRGRTCDTDGIAVDLGGGDAVESHAVPVGDVVIVGIGNADGDGRQVQTILRQLAAVLIGEAVRQGDADLIGLEAEIDQALRVQIGLVARPVGADVLDAACAGIAADLDGLSAGEGPAAADADIGTAAESSGADLLRRVLQIQVVVLIVLIDVVLDDGAAGQGDGMVVTTDKHAAVKAQVVIGAVDTAAGDLAAAEVEGTPVGHSGGVRGAVFGAVQAGDLAAEHIKFAAGVDLYDAGTLGIRRVLAGDLTGLLGAVGDGQGMIVRHMNVWAIISVFQNDIVSVEADPHIIQIAAPPLIVGGYIIEQIVAAVALDGLQAADADPLGVLIVVVVGTIALVLQAHAVDVLLIGQQVQIEADGPVLRDGAVGAVTGKHIGIGGALHDAISGDQIGVEADAGVGGNIACKDGLILRRGSHVQIAGGLVVPLRIAGDIHCTGYLAGGHTTEVHTAAGDSGGVAGNSAAVEVDLCGVFGAILLVGLAIYAAVLRCGVIGDGAAIHGEGSQYIRHIHTAAVIGLVILHAGGAVHDKFRRAGKQAHSAAGVILALAVAEHGAVIQRQRAVPAHVDGRICGSRLVAAVHGDVLQGQGGIGGMIRAACAAIPLLTHQIEQAALEALGTHQLAIGIGAADDHTLAVILIPSHAAVGGAGGSDVQSFADFDGTAYNDFDGIVVRELTHGAFELLEGSHRRGPRP